MKIVLAPLFLALFGFAGHALSQTYWADGAPYQWPGNGHYYQRFGCRDFSVNYTFADLQDHVGTLTLNGLGGHLVTYETLAEYNMPVFNSEKGIIGALGGQWITGGSMTIYGTEQACSVTSQACGDCRPIWLTNYLWKRWSYRLGCTGGVAGIINFSVEFEPPVVNAVLPDVDWSRGAQFTIKGYAFGTSAVPKIGGIDASPYARISATEIRATVPNTLVDGDYYVQVHMPGGVSSPFPINGVVSADLRSWSSLKATYR